MGISCTVNVIFFSEKPNDLMLNSSDLNTCIELVNEITIRLMMEPKNAISFIDRHSREKISCLYQSHVHILTNPLPSRQCHYHLNV